MFQACAAEGQENTLSELHGPVLVKNTSVPPRRSIRPPHTGLPGPSNRELACFSCGKLGHVQKNSPLSKPPPEATGLSVKPTNTISAPVNEQPHQLTRRDQ